MIFCSGTKFAGIAQNYELWEQDHVENYEETQKLERLTDVIRLCGTTDDKQIKNLAAGVQIYVIVAGIRCFVGTYGTGRPSG